jgi:hypothetical protein
VVYHISVSSAETRRAFHSGFDIVNLDRPTVSSRTTKSCVGIPSTAVHSWNSVAVTE